MGAERRKNPRVVVTDVSARVTIGSQTLSGHVQDICRDAVLVDVERAIALDTPAVVEVELPGTEGVLRANGHVVRVASFQDGRQSVAILFDDLPPEELHRVDRFIGEQEA
jgi:hypothetical protein